MAFNLQSNLTPSLPASASSCSTSKCCIVMFARQCSVLAALPIASCHSCIVWPLLHCNLGYQRGNLYSRFMQHNGSDSTFAPKKVLLMDWFPLRQENLPIFVLPYTKRLYERNNFLDFSSGHNEIRKDNNSIISTIFCTFLGSKRIEQKIAQFEIPRPGRMVSVV